jgi:DNA sulfur modification protein DndB
MTDNRGQLSFPAIKGEMAGRSYYVLLLPLAVVPTLLWVPDGTELTPEARAQRKLNERRIPEITRYILEHEDSWIFSSLTASFEEEERFVASNTDPNMGKLHLPITAKLLVNDGQHRRAAIERALRSDPTLGSQTISVVLFPAEDLERNQQMFSDLNRTVQKTSRSLDIIYNHRDPLNAITLALEERVKILRGRVEKESQSLAVRSAKLVTVSALYDMTAQFVGSSLNERSQEAEVQLWEDRLVDLWCRLEGSLGNWRDITAGELRPAEARAEYINVHAVFFFAIGAVARVMLDEGMFDGLKDVANIDWRRTNKEWQGVCMLGPDIVTRRQTRAALRDVILWKLGARSTKPEPVLALT